MTPTDQPAYERPDTITVISHETDPPAALLVRLMAPEFAHITDMSMERGTHLGRAVYPEHCSICHRAGLGDGSGDCRHKDALWEAIAATGPEAQYWLVDLQPEEALPF